MAFPVIGVLVGTIVALVTASETVSSEKKAIKNAVDRAYREVNEKITKELKEYSKISFWGTLILGLSFILGIFFGDDFLVVSVCLAYLYIFITSLSLIKKSFIFIKDFFRHKLSMKEYIYFLVYEEIYRSVYKEVNKKIDRLGTIDAICFKLFGSSAEDISKEISQKTTGLVIKLCFTKFIKLILLIILINIIFRMIIYPYIIEHYAQYSLWEILLFPLYKIFHYFV